MKYDLKDSDQICSLPFFLSFFLSFLSSLPLCLFRSLSNVILVIASIRVAKIDPRQGREEVHSLIETKNLEQIKKKQKKKTQKQKQKNKREKSQLKQ